jgi:hypothetical protein
MECASEDSTRHVLNGTFIDARDSKANYVVATDGRHLYSAAFVGGLFMSNSSSVRQTIPKVLQGEPEFVHVEVYEC